MKKIIKIYLYIKALEWTGIAIFFFILFHTNIVLASVISILMIINGAILLGSGLLFEKLNKTLLIFLALYVGINFLLNFADEVGLIDILNAASDLALAILIGVYLRSISKFPYPPQKC